jgi:hypothetical protein
VTGVCVPRASPRPWRVACPPPCRWGSAWPLGVGGDGGDGLLGVLVSGLAVGLGGGGAVVLRLVGGGRCGVGVTSPGLLPALRSGLRGALSADGEGRGSAGTKNIAGRWLRGAYPQLTGASRAPATKALVHPRRDGDMLRQTDG